MLATYVANKDEYKILVFENGRWTVRDLLKTVVAW